MKNQSGFKPCDSYIFLHFHNINASFDCNPTIDLKGVFLDISKAFGVAWGISVKLESYTIGGELLNLFKDYLLKCQRRVVLLGEE